MKLDRPLVALDLETTDAEATTCAIVEYGAVLMLPDGTRKQFSKRFKPWRPITAEAEEITGITNAMVADCPPFSEFSESILRSLRDKDFCGYNLRRFDLIVLDQEMRRCGLRLDVTGVQIIDAAGIFFRREPRDLSAAVKRYCGRDHEGAHGAGADAEAALEVFLAQREAYEDLAKMSLEEAAKHSLMDELDYVDLARKLYRDAEGHLRFGFGKNKDKRVLDETGYCRWMMGADFPGSTLDALSDELDRVPSRKAG